MIAERIGSSCGTSVARAINGIARWASNIRGTGLIAGVAMICACTNARAQEATKTTQEAPKTATEAPATVASPWSFQMTSYVWFAGLNGDVGVGGLPTVDVDVGFSDIFDAIDWWPPPLMLAGEVRYGRFAFVTDFMHLGVEGTKASPGPGNGSGEADIDTNMWTFGASFRAVQQEPFTLDLMAGGRLWNVNGDVTITGPLGGVREASDSETWVDPVFGIAGRVSLGEGFALRAMGDVGGFGVSSDLTWQVLGTVQYSFNDSIMVEAGYRYLVDDFKDNGFVFDVALSGPIIGASFWF